MIVMVSIHVSNKQLRYLLPSILYFNFGLFPSSPHWKFNKLSSFSFRASLYSAPFYGGLNDGVDGVVGVFLSDFIQAL